MILFLRKKSEDSIDELVPRMLFSEKSISFDQAKDIMEMKSKKPTDEEIQKTYSWILSTKKKMKAWIRDKIRQIQFEEAKRQDLEILDWNDIGKMFRKD